MRGNREDWEAVQEGWWSTRRTLQQATFPASLLFFIFVFGSSKMLSIFVFDTYKMSEPICLCLNRFWWMFGQILINASSEDLASHVSQTFNVIWASSIIAFWHDASKNVRQSTIVVLKPDSNIFFFPQQIFSKWAKFRYYWVIMKKFGSHLSGQRHRLILFPDLQRNSQDWIKWEKWEWKKIVNIK